jgi:hypothetical protein
MKSIVTLLAVAGLAGVAQAQAFPTNTNLVFEVWNGSSWSSTTNALPGASVSFRVRAEWTGPAGAVAGLSNARYQPYFVGTDNAGASQDSLSPLSRNAANANGDLATGTIIAQPSNINAAPASNATGRVGFGSFAMQPSAFNALTFFRHNSGERGAPVIASGGFIRISGHGGTGTVGTFTGDNVSTYNNATWPAASIAANDTASNNRVLRGVAASQTGSLVAGQPNPNYSAGTNVVIFQGTFIVSSDAGQDRTVTLTSDQTTLAREGGASSSDDRRRVVWQATPDEISGSVKSGVNFIPASIVIPSPASLALVGLGGLVAARRRRA